MRGQDNMCIEKRANKRITPADAGTSLKNFRILVSLEDHPRGCGDKEILLLRHLLLRGSPPRMRGQELRHFGDLMGQRITPADAGTRSARFLYSFVLMDHPRGCGDKAYNDGWIGSKWGSPPRMRGQDTWVSMDCHTPRITPADAGTRALMREGLNEMKDHPRGCGDKLS